MGEDMSGQTQVVTQPSAASTGTPAPVLIQDTVPAMAFAMVGDEITFTAVFSNSPTAVFQWQKISGGTAVDIPGATGATLTLSNLRVADSASYQLKSVNATNQQASTCASARPLVVEPLPAALNGIVTAVAAQTGLGDMTAFTPTWTVATNGSLIAGQSPSDATGDFSLQVPGRNVGCLTLGGNGSLTMTPIPGAPGLLSSCTNYVTCGNSNQAGSSVTYTLSGSKTGYDLTNITVYGGWSDNGRDQQAYTVYISTVLAPDLFVPLSVVDFTPADPAGAQSATRVTLRPASGALARNVAAVKFYFTTPASKNGFCGYSRIILSGAGSAALSAREIPEALHWTGTNIRSGLTDVDLLGSWIWDAKTYDGQTCQFWRAFDIPADGKVTHARLLMTVDNEFIYYLDGRELGRGDDWRELFDHNLTPLITPGRHVLAIKAFNSAKEAGLVLGLRVDLADGRFVEIKSDQNWRIVPNEENHFKEMTKARADWPAATVMAALGAGPWWVQPHDIATMLVPPPIKILFWQTAWFQITFLTLCGFFLLTIFFLAAQLALHQKERWLLQRERARIAMDIHDDIGSRITQLVLNGEDAQEQLSEDSQVRLKLVRIWDDARDVLGSIDEILWALNPRLDTLRDFANYICDYASKVLEPAGIACVFEVDAEMQLAVADLPLRRSLLMAVKETLNNIVKHSRATEVHLKIERQHQHLIVEVRDNGRGFDLAAIKPGRNGLDNMSRRMRELGGKCHLSSQPGAGCGITFSIPLKRPRRFSWLRK